MAQACQLCTSTIHVKIAKIWRVVYCWWIHISCSTITNSWLLLLLLLLLGVKCLKWDRTNNRTLPVLAVQCSAEVPQPRIVQDSWTFKAAAISWPVGMNSTIESTGAGLRPIECARLTHQANLKVSVRVECTIAWRAHATPQHRQCTHAQRPETQISTLWNLPKCYIQVVLHVKNTH